MLSLLTLPLRQFLTNVYNKSKTSPPTHMMLLTILVAIQRHVMTAKTTLSLSSVYRKVTLEVVVFVVVLYPTTVETVGICAGGRAIDIFYNIFFIALATHNRERVIS